MKVKNLNSHIEHIINGYKQQYRCYEQLLQLSRQQGTLTSEDEFEVIEKVINQKEGIINILKEIDQNIKQHQEAVINLLHLNEFRLDKVQDLIHINLRDELTEQRTAIEKIIEAIIETDRKNEDILKNLKQDVAKELRSIQQYHEVQQAYFDRPEKFPEPRFFDKKK